MKIFSLFSGIGGFDLAARNMGHEVVGACEIDEHARSIYEKHFTGVPVWHDATKINPNDLPDFDVLVGGFPCQAFSVAGKRAGFEDTRGTLFFEIARIAQQKRPRYLLLENVKGLLSHERGETIRVIFKTLDELGYDTESSIINTKNFIPQNRERIFIIATLRGEPRREIFPLRVHAQKTTTRCNQLNNPTHSTNRVYGTDGIARALKSECGNKAGYYAVKPTLTAVGERIITNQDETRLRTLTPIECERLQGFPDNWTEGISDTQRRKCCGNAVTVPVIEYLFKQLESPVVK